MFDVVRVRDYWSDLEFTPTDEVIEFHFPKCPSCGGGSGSRHVALARLVGEVEWVRTLICEDCFGFLVNHDVPDHAVFEGG